MILILMRAAVIILYIPLRKTRWYIAAKLPKEVKISSDTIKNIKRYAQMTG